MRSAPQPRKAAVALVAALLALLLAEGAHAAPSARPDVGFGTDGNVMALARVGDTIYVGGAFSEIGPSTGPGISLSRATAQRNVAFPGVSGVSSGFAAEVHAVLADGAGGWWIGGDFGAVGGVPHANIAHVLADGSVAAGTASADGPVHALALAPGGDTLYVGGDFTAVGGQPRSRIAALATASGALQPWAPTTTIGNGSVTALAADAADVYVGGSFTGIGGANGNRLMAFDASNGNIAWSGNANGTVLALAVDPSRLYVAGAFTTLLPSNTAAARLATVNLTGTLVLWNGNVTTPSSEVDSLVLSGSSLFAAGTFTATGGTIGSGAGSATRDGVAKLNSADGGVSAAWNPGADGQVAAMALAGSTLYLGGGFGTVGGVARSRVAAVDADTGASAGWSPAAPNSGVRAVAADATSVYAGGTFDSVGVAQRGNVAAIDAATGDALPWAPDVDSEVYGLAATATTVFIGGSFSRVNGDTHDFIAAVSASDGQTVPGWNTSAQSYVNAVALSGSRLFIGGYFADVDGTPAQGVAALDAADGALITSWKGEVTAGFPVETLAVSPDGASLYVGGWFVELNGSPRNYAGAFATSDGSLLRWDPNPDAAVYAIRPANGVVYVGGDFLAIGGQGRGHVAALDPATGSATSWNPDADDRVGAIATVGSEVYLGGRFATVGGAGRRGLAAVDAASGAVSGWYPGPSDDVLALLGGSDGTLVAGGWFRTMTAGPASRLAIFSSAPASTGAPELSGTALPGQTLACSLGTWTGSTPLSFARQWLVDGAPIGGAIGATYVVADGDVGHTLACRVTATNRAGSAAASSAGAAVPAPETGGTPPPGGGSPPTGELPPPRFRRTANAFPRGGVVLIKVPGSSRFVRLTKPSQVVFGSIIDATRGRVRICTADAAGRVQCADFFRGRFKLLQRGPGSRPVTELVLVGGSFRRCPPVGRRASAAARKLKRRSTVRQLWGSGTGRFRTKGRFASATVRGTLWRTADRCDGTLVTVQRGAVTVRDLVKRRNVVLRTRRGARRSYLAKPRARRR